MFNHQLKLLIKLVLNTTNWTVAAGNNFFFFWGEGCCLVLGKIGNTWTSMLSCSVVWWVFCLTALHNSGNIDEKISWGISKPCFEPAWIVWVSLKVKKRCSFSCCHNRLKKWVIRSSVYCVWDRKNLGRISFSRGGSSVYGLAGEN